MELGTKVQFKLPDQNGKIRDTKEFLGKPLVIYFYPKDNTPGCTTQALLYKDLYEEFEKIEVPVIGISKDNQKSHQKFIEKQGLPFILLTDEDLKVSEKLGFAGEKNMYGRKYFGTIRSSIVLDKEGKVRMVNKKTKPKEDAQKVLDFIKTNLL